MQQIMDLIQTLRHYFAADPMVYTWGDMLMYYEEGNPRVSVAPDVFLVKGIQNEVRRIYKVWEEGKAPDLVVEVSSKSTWAEDAGRKKSCLQPTGCQRILSLRSTEGVSATTAPGLSADE